ncbi:MAG: DUF3048 domain-containing protein [Patescibacteria group bacterium]
MTKLVKIQIKIAALLILVGGFFIFFIYYQISQNSDNHTLIDNNQNEEIFYNKLDGTKTSKENQDVSPIAIIIENHVDARPQSGLSKARIVYEILTESDITRFLAIYDLSENLEKIGPVRSARPYFIDLASEYRAIYVHSGGSSEALNRLRNDEVVFNLDEFFGYNSGYFWRDDKRYAPHNLYTSSELLSQAKNNYDIVKFSDFTSWKFKDGKSESVQNYDIKINYSEDTSYQVIWKYLKDVNQYERWQNNNRHIDDDGSIIEADNIIIQYVQTKILDEIGRKDIKLIGTGKLIVFRDGITIEGSWQKKDASSRTMFYDEDNNEIELNRGKIWIEVVPTDMEISY